MSEPAKSILAYQQTPIIISSVQSKPPTDAFLVSMTDDEKQYVTARSQNPLESIMLEVISNVGAAGILSTAPQLVIDVHTKTPRLHKRIDQVSLPLSEDESTQRALVEDYVVPFRELVENVYKKTEKRFGSAIYVHIGILPRFHEGTLVQEEIALFGEPILEDATKNPEHLKELYDTSYAKTLERHALILVHPKFFTSPSLISQLTEKLSLMRQEVIAHR